MFLRDRPELASQIPRKKGNTTTVTTPRASTPQTAGVEDSNMTSQGRETSQLISLSFPMLASPSLLSSNPSAMGGAHLSNPPPSTSTGNVDFLSSLVFSPNNTNSSSLSSLCASRLGQELLSLLSRPAPQLPTSVSSTVSPITTGLLQHAGPENNAALLELLLRSEGAGTSVNGTSITSAAAGHYRNLLNRNMTNWQHQRPPDDRR